MARPIKEGLSYFPLDVDSDYDDKFQLIESLYGPTGFASVVKVFMKIYSAGYYYKWEEKEQILMAKRIGIDSNVLNNIISDCVKYELFNEKLFNNFSILTSNGIQKRFFTAVGKRKVGVIIEEFLLIDREETLSLCPKMTFKRVIQDKTEVVHGETRVIQESSTQSKVKETKVDKTKVNNSRSTTETNTPAAPNNLSDINAHEFYQNNFGVESPTIMQSIEYWIADLSEELVVEALKRAALDQKGYRYAEGIMKNWDKKGLKTLDEIKSEDVAFEKSKSKTKYSGQPTRKETLPEWAQEGYVPPESKGSSWTQEDEEAFKREVLEEK